MQIEIVHVPRCPNLDLARERVRAALARTGVTASMREVEVDSIDAAARARMSGSPTILVDGADPFAAGASQASVSCRLFSTDSGSDGAPSVEQLAAVLSAWGADPDHGEEA